LNANGIDTSTVLSNGNLITNSASPPPLLLMNGSSTNTTTSSSSSSVTSTALVAVNRAGSNSNGLQLPQQQKQLVFRGHYTDIEDILPEWRQPYGRFENPYVGLLQSEKIEALESQGASRLVLMFAKLSLYRNILSKESTATWFSTVGELISALVVR
jgi:hypothetical protein